jgi:hypothetical protein
MAKTTRVVDGRVTTLTKHQKRSTETPIPWTPGPQTAWQKFVRKAVG